MTKLCRLQAASICVCFFLCCFLLFIISFWGSWIVETRQMLQVCRRSTGRQIQIAEKQWQQIITTTRKVTSFSRLGLFEAVLRAVKNFGLTTNATQKIAKRKSNQKQKKRALYISMNETLPRHHHQYEAAAAASNAAHIQPSYKFPSVYSISVAVVSPVRFFFFFFSSSSYSIFCLSNISIYTNGKRTYTGPPQARHATIWVTLRCMCVWERLGVAFDFHIW